MKKSVAAFMTALALCLSSAAMASSSMSLKHKGMECAACHGTATPSTYADQKACIQCHGQYKGKVVPNADYNPDRNPRRPVVEVNPHDSHFGNVRCTLCHKEHTKSPKPVCNDCHQNFRLNTK